MVFTGIVKARIVDARFASSGKVSRVAKFTGSRVNKGELLASLDRRIPQSELDRQLADYEKIRADFEIFAAKYPDPVDQIDKYLKTQKQAALNASVKEVEVAKINLDTCDLFSPVNGTILDDSSVVPGINITPASASFKIIDDSSFYVEVEIEEKSIKEFNEPKDVSVTIDSISFNLKTKTDKLISDGKKFYLRIAVADKNLFLGLSTTLEV